MFNDRLVPEKPIDLVLNYIEGMKEDLEAIDLMIERLQKQLIDRLNEKIVLEDKLARWHQVAERFRFKKKKV